jgi:hypothetical protein
MLRVASHDLLNARSRSTCGCGECRGCQSEREAAGGEDVDVATLFLLEFGSELAVKVKSR